MTSMLSALPMVTVLLMLKTTRLVLDLVQAKLGILWRPSFPFLNQPSAMFQNSSVVHTFTALHPSRLLGVFPVGLPPLSCFPIGIPVMCVLQNLQWNLVLVQNCNYTHHTTTHFLRVDFALDVTDELESEVPCSWLTAKHDKSQNQVRSKASRQDGIEAWLWRHGATEEFAVVDSYLYHGKLDRKSLGMQDFEVMHEWYRWREIWRHERIWHGHTSSIQIHPWFILSGQSWLHGGSWQKNWPQWKVYHVTNV